MLEDSIPRCLLLIVFIDLFRHQLLWQLECIRINNLKFRKHFRLGIIAAKNSHIGDVVKNMSHCSLMPIAAGPRLNALIPYQVCNFAPPIAGPNTQIEHHPDYTGLIFVDFQFVDLMFSLVETPASNTSILLISSYASGPIFS